MENRVEVAALLGVVFYATTERFWISVGVFVVAAVLLHGTSPREAADTILGVLYVGSVLYLLSTCGSAEGFVRSV